jgi:hypothetical protein
MQSAMQPVIQGLMQAGMDALVQCLMEVHKLQPLLQCLIQFHKLQALVLALEVLLHAVIVCPLLLFFQPLSLVCSALHLFHHFFHSCLVSSAHHWLVCSALHSSTPSTTGWCVQPSTPSTTYSITGWCVQPSTSSSTYPPHSTPSTPTTPSTTPSCVHPSPTTISTGGC